MQHTISVQAAQQHIAQGAVLIDIRTKDEHMREHIPHAQRVSMDQLAGSTLLLDENKTVIFYCRSGNRTRINAQALTTHSAGKAYILEGGLDAWKKAGLPVVTDKSQPLELQRQVHIAAGAMVFLGTVLGIGVTPWFLLFPGFVGAGLMFAGITGFCGLARLLLRMPWNKRVLNS